MGGHLDLTTLRSSTCNCRTITGIDRVRMISIKVTPSMKKDIENTFNLFDIDNC